MRKLLAVLLLSLCGTAVSAEGLTCQDVDNMGEALTALGVALDDENAQIGAEQQKLAVDSGYWPLFRYDPRQAGEGKNPLRLDSSPPKVDLGKFMANETRFAILRNIAPERADALLLQAQDAAG